MGLFWRRRKDGQTNAPSVDSGLVPAMERADDGVRQDSATKGRFFNAIGRARNAFTLSLQNIFLGDAKINAENLENLEELLISADIGVANSTKILEAVRGRLSRNEINNLESLKEGIRQEIFSLISTATKTGISSEEEVLPTSAPYVIMVCGVNGVGKTTTIGKLAQRISAEGQKVMVCAADTFRAAASKQLGIWAERSNVELITQGEGTDPAAVLFDSLTAAKARGIDVLIVDTAGRLHNKAPLMAELEKMKRVASREVPGAPHETLLVIDAVTGQNGLEQARQFMKTVEVTGIVLTKLDGTAKGGIAVAIAAELEVPIRYVGVGEHLEDLLIFDPATYVDGLLS